MLAVISLTLMPRLVSRQENAKSFRVFESQGQDSEQANELTQASDLSAEVVKLFGEKRYNEALPLAKQVVEIRDRLLSPSDPLLGSALSNVGFLYVATKKDNEAEKVFQRALTVYESHPEKNELAIGRILNALAYIRVRRHDYDRAEPLLVRALQIQEKQLGPINPKIVEAMKDYACFNLLRANTGIMFGREPDPLKRRAMCWLYGFESDCTKEEVKPEDVLTGKAVKLAQPFYPVEARQKRLAGRVFVAILIDESGNVLKARAVCGGYPELNAAGVEAARLSKFAPTQVNGAPVQASGIIIYNFVAR